MGGRIPDRYDSRFRFVLVAAERAKQIHSGAPPHLQVRSAKPAYIAIKEAEQDLIDFIILEEDLTEPQESVRTDKESLPNRDRAIAGSAERTET